MEGDDERTGSGREARAQRENKHTMKRRGALSCTWDGSSQRSVNCMTTI